MIGLTSQWQPLETVEVSGTLLRRNVHKCLLSTYTYILDGLSKEENGTCFYIKVGLQYMIEATHT